MTRTDLSAEAVWEALERTGDGYYSGDAGKFRIWSPNGTNSFVRYSFKTGDIDIVIFPTKSAHLMAPALAALSRLLGDTGHAAPELGEGV